MLQKDLTVNELKYVSEFYGVLDAQILKLQNDQEAKLAKTQKLRDQVFQMVKQRIEEVFQTRWSEELKVKVDIYGSMATGLAIDSSDLDILVRDYIPED